MELNIGNYLLVVSVILIFVLGIASEQIGAASSILMSILVILGFVVGMTSVPHKDAKDFLLASVALIVIAFTGNSIIDSWKDIQFIGAILKGIFDNILAFLIPASIVVALRVLLSHTQGHMR